MEKIKVLQLVEDLKIGGAERVIANIAEGLDRQRFEVSVWCICQGGEIAEELINKGIKVEILGMRSHRSPLFFLKLCKKMKRNRVEVLHVHGYTATTLGRLAAIFARVPVIFAHLHSTYWGYTRKQLWIEKQLSRFTHKIICCSQAVARFAIEQEGIDPVKTVVIYNGTDGRELEPDTQVREEFGLSPEDLTVGCIASLTSHKGHRYLLEAVKEVREKFPMVKILLVGNGPLRKKLEEDTRELGISSNIIFCGLRKDIAELLSVMDVVVLPSSEREGLGISLIEAMAAGKPVIGTNIGGIPEVIEKDKTGILVPPKDPEALARAILSLLENKELAKRMGESGKRLFEQKFTRRVMLNNIEGLYTQFGVGKIRILYLSGFSEIVGGGQVSLLHLLKRIDRSQILPLAVCPGEGVLVRKISDLNIETKILDFRSFKTLQWIRIICVSLQLRRLIRKRNIQLIHCDTPRTAIYAGLSSPGIKIPIVFHARVSDSTGFVDRIVFLFSKRIICVSQSTAKRFIRLADFEKKIRVIYNGVDTEKFKPGQEGYSIRKEYNLSPDCFLIGYIGQLIPLKGLDILFQAFSLVQKSFPQTRLIVVGSGKEEYEQKLKDLVRRLGLSSCVMFTGYREDIHEVMAALDLFVLPTLYKEGFSRVILEAMASAKPVITTSLGGNPEAVIEGVSGLLIPQGDSKALAHAILSLLKDKELAKRMGEAGRRQVVEMFAIEKNISNTEELYLELVKGK